MEKLPVLRYYCRAVLVPAVLVMLMFGWGLVSAVYLSENLIDDDYFDGLVGLLFATHALYFCLASLPIFLNRFKVVRANRGLSSVTWLLLPLGLICVLVLEGFVSGIAGQGFPYLLLAGCDLVYMVGLLIAHAGFRREQVRLAA